MEEKQINRRRFLQNLGMVGAGVLAATGDRAAPAAAALGIAGASGLGAGCGAAKRRSR